MRRLLAAIVVVGLAGCGDAAKPAPQQAGAAREVSAWRAAAAAYDQTIGYCAGSPTPAADFWAHCTGRAAARYTRAANALTHTLRRHSGSGPCAAAAREVAFVTRSYKRMATVTNRSLNLAARHRYKRADRLPRFGRLIAAAHAARLRGTAAVAAQGRDRCLR